MRFNYSFCIAFLLLAHMSTAVPLTGVDNGEEFTGNKILPSSLEKTSEAKPENAVKSETLRSKRGYDYSDYSSESSEEYFGYFNKPHHYHFNTHWPNNPYHRLPPTPPTEAYVFWRPASSRSPYYHGKYHNHQHDKKYLSKSRKKRNTISVDDVDDQENYTVFPSRPLFVSMGQTSFKEAINVRPLRPVAVPLSVGLLNIRKKRKTISVDDQDSDIVFPNRPHFISNSNTGFNNVVNTKFSKPVDDSLSIKSNVNGKPEEEISTTSSGKIRRSFIAPYHKRRARQSLSYPSHNRRKYPAPPPPSFRGRHPPPPPNYHYSSSGPYHHQPPPPPYYPPPPPPHHHSHPRQHHYPPSQENPHINYEPTPLSPSHSCAQGKTTQAQCNKKESEDQVNVSTKDNSLNQKIEEIFGNSTTEEYDIGSLIDIRMKT